MCTNIKRSPYRRGLIFIPCSFYSIKTKCVHIIFQAGSYFCHTLCMPVMLILVFAEQAGSIKAGSPNRRERNGSLVRDNLVSHQELTHQETANTRQKRFTGNIFLLHTDIIRLVWWSPIGKQVYHTTTLSFSAKVDLADF